MHPYLIPLISHLPSDQLITITGATPSLRNGDVHYPFRQDSDFLYLTGLSVPGLVLTILVGASQIQNTDNKILSLAPVRLDSSFTKEPSEIILWREAITDLDRVWGSDKLTDEEMRDISGIEDIRDMSELEEYSGQFESKEQILRTPRVLPTLREGASSEGQKGEWKSIVHSLRLTKTPDEIERIRKAIAVSQEAFAAIESMMRPGVYEYEIEAEIARVYRSHHLTEAYPSIVASGPSACILHYTAHTRQLTEGDLVLVDAGAEYMGYASDMTRTFAVSPLSPRQLAVYDAVEQIKKIAENTLRPGISLTEYEQIVRTAMNQELSGLGLIPHDATLDETAKLSRKYYPHRTSHFLGLDVHDVGPRDAVITPGMVLTIEPGIYIPDEAIGIRLEDDYLITDTGCSMLS